MTITAEHLYAAAQILAQGDEPHVDRLDLGAMNRFVAGEHVIGGMTAHLDPVAVAYGLRVGVIAAGIVHAEDVAAIRREIGMTEEHRHE